MRTDPPLPEISSEVQKAPPTSEAGGRVRGPLIGGLALIAVVMDARQEARTIVEPFASCHSIGDIIVRLSTMNDATFLGVLTAVVLLSVPVAAIGWTIATAVKARRA